MSQAIRRIAVFVGRRRSIFSVFFICVALIAGLLLIYMRQIERSYIVQVDTHSARVQFLGSSSKPWQLEAATLCQRHKDRSRSSHASAATADAVCDPRYYEQFDLNDAIVEWPDGATIRLLHTSSNTGLEIFVESSGKRIRIGGITVSDMSRIVIPSETWNAGGNLIFSGIVTIGSPPNSGVGDHLISGKYEVRETLFLRKVPTSVKWGEFFAGDEVVLLSVDGNRTVPSTGFISSGPTSESEQSFNIVAYSAVADSYMQVNRLGAAPSIILPAWPDRAINDPVLLGLTALLALVVAAVGLLSGVHSLRAGGGRARSEPNRPRRNARRARKQKRQQH